MLSSREITPTARRALPVGDSQSSVLPMSLTSSFARMPTSPAHLSDHLYRPFQTKFRLIVLDIEETQDHED